ncbi:MAG TPA: HupE/UreJ family protein [Candidatus Baltobacteraceae bacterium]|nr:HupE/UreJ family protein [Candidatus Baltobacteraceae bacterium]
MRNLMQGFTSGVSHRAMRSAWFALLLLVACAPNLNAHEMRPAYLQLQQTGPETYNVFWKVPAVSDNMRLSLYVQLPDACSNLAPPRASFANGAYTEQWSINCPGGLSGSTIRIDGLSATLTDVLVRVERLDGSAQVTRLASSSPSFIVEAAPHRLEVARTYLLLGIEHILTGVDHLLFVSGLLLLVTGFRRLLLTVSAFTLSHTVTLTLATLGFVHIPPAPVEAVIALSIFFVAYEILRRKENPDGLAQRKPWLVAFSFGLLHGLGFAGGLSAAGLPVAHIPLALGFFSAGVEVGHFSFVAVAVLLLAAVRHWTIRLPIWSWRLPPYAIGGVAAYWLIVRFAAF